MVFVSGNTLGFEIWKVWTQAAFLQDDEIEREIFILLSEGFAEYGFNDAPEMWYKRVEKGKQSFYDNALFLWHDDNDQLCGILVTHVDYFIFCRTKK